MYDEEFYEQEQTIEKETAENIKQAMQDLESSSSEDITVSSSEEMETEEGSDYSLEEMLTDINNTVTALKNDNTSLINEFQNRLDNIESQQKSIMASLNALDEVLEKQDSQIREVTENLSKNISTLQSSIVQINDATSKSIEAFKAVSEELPKKLEQDCEKINKAFLANAVANFNRMSKSANNWLKKINGQYDYSSRAIGISATLTPMLVMLLIVMFAFKF